MRMGYDQNCCQGTTQMFNNVDAVRHDPALFMAINYQKTERWKQITLWSFVCGRWNSAPHRDLGLIKKFETRSS